MRDIVNGWLLPEQDGPATKMWRSVWVRANMTKTMAPDFKDDDSVNSEESATSRPSIKSTGSSWNSAEPFAKYHGTPWRIGKEPYPPGIVGLHKEIEDYYDYIKPTPAEQAMRLAVVQRISDLIKRLWPEAIVDYFGSFKTGLYLPTSDIDMVVLGKWEAMPLFSLEKHLIDSGLVDKKTLKVLDKATVPIIKLTDVQTRIKVDISFNTNNGLKSVNLIQEYIATYPTLVKLVFVLKQFLLQRDLKDVFTGGISSYSLILLVVSFLQRHPREEARSRDVNLGVLLLEFFEHYGKYFNFYQNAIRVTNGGSLISKNELMAYDSNYSPSILTIEDPLDATNDIGKNSYGALHVKRAFEAAFSNLYRAIGPLKGTVDPSTSILGRIILISDELVDKRKETVRRSSLSLASRHDGSHSSIATGEIPLCPSSFERLDDHCSVSPKSDHCIVNSTAPITPISTSPDNIPVPLTTIIPEPAPPASRASSLEPLSKNLKMNNNNSYYKKFFPPPPLTSSYSIPVLHVPTTHAHNYANFSYYTGIPWPVFPMNSPGNGPVPPPPPPMNILHHSNKRPNRYPHNNSNHSTRPVRTNSQYTNWKHSSHPNHNVLSSANTHNNAQRSSSSSSPSSDEGISKTSTDKITPNNVPPPPYKPSGMIYR